MPGRISCRGEVVAVASQEADEMVLLAVAAALALAQGKNAQELGVLAGFAAVVGDILALLSVVLAAEETEKAEGKTKEAEESLEARLKKIEEQLKTLTACCEGKEKK